MKIRVNKKLEKAVEFNPTKKSHQLSILDLCKKIEDQTLSLPLYQRDLSWTIQKCVSLLNYQLLGKAPVSPISINVILDTEECVPQVSFIEREVFDEVKRGQYSVVDGQQRLTTNYKAYIDHDDFRNIVLDLGKGEFTEVRGAIRENQIPVGVLLYKNDDKLRDYINNHKSLSQTAFLLLQVKSKIKNYNYTINSAEDLSEDEQIEWFEVLNNAGSRVSIVQMRFAKMKSRGIDVYTQYTKVFRDKLANAGIDDFFTPQKTTTSYPIAALNPAYEKITGKPHSNNYAPISSDISNQLCTMRTDEWKKCFSLTLEALDVVLDFLEDNSLEKPDRVDYINYLIGYFVFNGYDISDITRNKLIKWYNTVDFTNKSNSDRRELFNNLIKIK